MKKSILKLIVFIFISTNLTAQNDLFKNYKSIESSGEIPQEFISKSSEVVQDELDDFIQDSKGNDKEYKTDFLVNSTFSTKQVLLSGKVLFNDPVTKYVNKVAAEIFKANSDLDKEDFKIYAYKSPIVNALAFNDGLVLINLGLIAQLENEAQLALILSHEFHHVVNEDAIEMYLESKEIENGEGAYKNVSYDDKMLYKSKYSQEIESEADLEGLEYYKSTKYSMKPVNGVFDVLKYSYLPFDDIAFDTTYFENEFYKFPSEYKLQSVNPISPDGLENEDEDEEILKSHPDAEERREAALNEITIAEIKDSSKKVFLVSNEAEFEKIRNICRFEMPRMYLLHGYYEMAFYNAFLLEEKGFKDNLYLDKIKAKALGQMARMINHGDRPSRAKLTSIEEDMQGESQQLYFFLNSVGRSKKEFNVFATQYTYKMLKNHPKDEELETLFDLIVEELFDETSLKYKDFKKTRKAVILEEDSLTVESKNYNAEKELREKSEKEKLMDEIRDSDSKYNKIEKKVIEEQEIVEEKIEKKKKDKDYYYKYAFADYLNDSKFSKKLKSTEKRLKAENDKTLTKKETNNKRKDEKLNYKRGYALGIDKITIVNPVYFSVSDKNQTYFKTEKGQEDLNKIIQKLDKKSKLEIEMLDIRNGSTLDSKTFQNATILNEFIGEQFLFDEPLEYSSIEKEKLDRLKDGFDTKYFLWTGIISSQDKKRTFFYNLLFNLETNKVEFKSFKNIRAKTNKTIIKSELYHVFDQINTKRKFK